VQVNGLLQSQLGDLSIASNPGFTTSSAAAGGTVFAGRDINEAGALAAGSLGAGRNMAIVGDAIIQTATQAGGSIAVTGRLTAPSVAAGQSLSITGPTAALSGASQVTAGGQLAVANGGTLQNTAVGNFTVTGGSIAVTGSNSKIAKSGSGVFTVQATGGGAALAAAGGGQIVGSQVGDTAILANVGTIAADGQDAILANNQGAASISAQSLSVVGTGSQNPQPVVNFANSGQAAITANTIVGTNGALIGATNQGDLQVGTLSGNSLSMRGTTLEKDNAQGNIQIQAPSLSLTDSIVNLFSNPPPNSTSLVNGGNIILKASNLLQLIGSEVRNRGLGNAATSNNITLDTATLQMANSVAETRTNPTGDGGHIVITHGTVSNTKIIYGTALTGQFQETGAVDFRVVPLSQPNIRNASASTQNIFATTHDTKLPGIAALNATNVVQAQTLVPINQWQTHVSLDELRSNPCGKAGSSLTVSGTAGFGAQPRLSMPLPLRKGGASARPAPYGMGSAGVLPADGESLKLAALTQASSPDCN
jgi:hypothetical protein